MQSKDAYWAGQWESRRHPERRADVRQQLCSGHPLRAADTVLGTGDTGVIATASS